MSRLQERRFNSRSTASRMKSERFSLPVSAASIRARVPSAKRAGVCSPLILGRPTGAAICDITFCAKLPILLISPIDRVHDISYLDDITYGGQEMTTLTKTERFVLNEVDSCPDKVASPYLVQRAARLTTAGFRRVVDRMTGRNLLGWTDDRDLTLTFGGMQAMRANGMEVQ